MSFPILLLLIAGAFIFILMFLYFVPVNLWITAVFSNVRISIMDLVLMRLRKVPPSIVVNALINSTKAGLTVTANEIETHFLAGGNVNNVVKALISADKANIPLTFKMATAIDLAGRDVADAVQLSVNPRVIDTPPVSAVGKNGIQLIVRARVTVRANINQLVGGAG
ncbi:MAG: flotillin-like FloA family protein, partial [Bacteroidota bacterium]